MSVASGRVAEKDVEALDGVTDLLRRDGLSGAYGCDPGVSRQEGKPVWVLKVERRGMGV